MANPKDLERALAGDKNLRGADLKDARLTWADLRGADLRGADLTDVNGIGADFTDADLTNADFSGADLIKAVFTNADLTNAKGIHLSISLRFPHKGETIEERIRRDSAESLVEARNELESIKKLIKKTKSHRGLYKIERTLLTPLLAKIKKSEILDDDPDLWEERHQALDCYHRREEQLDRKRKRREEIEYLKTQVTKAKGDKELESLAQEVGELQAQPEYVRYKKTLSEIQEEIEEKYSLLGKGMRYLKRLFRRGRRASQIRTASQMLNQLNKEIAHLKKVAIIMANPKDLERALAGDKNLEGADLTRADLNGADLKGAKLKSASLFGARLKGADLRGADLTDTDLRGADLRGAILIKANLYRAFVEFARLKGADLTDAKGIPLSISDKFPHKGETVEEKARVRLRREVEERLRREEEERLRRKTIQDVTKRVSRAKKDKDLEDLAQEVGSLQAQPEYVKEHKKVLNDLQEEIEKKYSLLGKGRSFLKRLFRRGRRASQIRTASKMLNQLNKEIADLKKDL